MADNRKEYTVTLNGIEHTMLLGDAEVKRYGDAAKPATKSASKPANKARTTNNK